MQDIRKTMEKAIEHLKGELAKLRVGRASTAMVDSVRVDMYGSQMQIREVAAITIPDARTIAIQPWDKGSLGEIEKAILAANIGITPMNDGNLIRISLPPITEDRRKDFAKQIKKYGEDAKVSLRNVRRDAIDGVKKKAEKTEDEMRKFQDEVQKLTDQFTAEIDKIVDSKTKEVMTI